MQSVMINHKIFDIERSKDLLQFSSISPRNIVIFIDQICRHVIYLAEFQRNFEKVVFDKIIYYEDYVQSARKIYVRRFVVSTAA